MKLNSQQQKAVNCSDSVLVLSGAGTGKTRVIVARIAKLLEDGVAPEAILAVTFTNKAAREMRSRVGSNAYKCTMCTFHSFGVRVLRQHAAAAGLKRNFAIMGQGEQVTMLRQIMQDQMGLSKTNDGGPDPRRIARYLNNYKEAGYRPATVPEDMLNSQREISDPDVLREVYRRYTEQCQHQGKADFAELLLRTLELFDDHRDIRKEWTKRFRYILIDELQDVNPIQLELLARLKARSTVFFGVGDDDQSIYAFRGAMPNSLHEFKRKFTKNKILHLEKNYRSTTAILELANQVISQNDDRLGKNLTGNIGKGDKPKLTCYPDDEAEARGIARAISELQDDGVDLAKIAVFYRNHALSQLLEGELTQRGVPFVMRGGQLFFEREEIKDVLAYLRVAANTADEGSILRAVNKPPRKVGGKTLEPLLAATAITPLWEQLQDSGHAGISSFVGIIDEIRQVVDYGDLVKVVTTAIEASGLQDYYAKKSRDGDREQNLAELVNHATRYQRSQESNDLTEYINDVTLDDDIEQSNEQVTLMTIHAAKGLEFDHVFLLGLEDGILPGFRDDTNQNEERRLLYVAITRACANLHLSFAKRRMQFGQYQDTSPSRFLSPDVTNLVEIKIEEHPKTANMFSPPRNYSNSRKFAPSASSKQNLNGYKVGQKVSSKKFGAGVILALEGDGDAAKANVLFYKDRKQRWLILTMANLS